MINHQRLEMIGEVAPQDDLFQLLEEVAVAEAIEDELLLAWGEEEDLLAAVVEEAEDVDEEIDFVIHLPRAEYTPPSSPQPTRKRRISFASPPSLPSLKRHRSEEESDDETW